MNTKMDVKDGTLYMYPTEFTDENEAEEINQTLEKFFKEHGKLSLFIQMETYKNSTNKARFILGEYLKENKNCIDKVAFVKIKNPLYELAVRTVMALGGFARYRFFENANEALAWLNSKED